VRGGARPTINSRRPGGFEVGIGVNTGKVVAGAIGGAGRLSFSVIGDAVNLCSRVEAATGRRATGADHWRYPRPALETIEVEPRGEREIRGYDRRVELFAPLVRLRSRPVPDRRQRSAWRSRRRWPGTDAGSG
jgi:class 3 adenylate cyclase